jgi:hypothetical protein
VRILQLKVEVQLINSLKSFLDMRNEYTNINLLNQYEIVWSGPLQELAILESEKSNRLLMLQKIYKFFNKVPPIGFKSFSISVGDIIEVQEWEHTDEASMILVKTECYYCETNGFQSLKTIIIDFMRLKPGFSNEDLSGKPLREQIAYMYDIMKTMTTCDLFGLQEDTSKDIVDIARLVELLHEKGVVIAQLGDIIQFNEINRYMYNGANWIRQISGRIKTPLEYMGVQAVFMLERIPLSWRYPSLFYYEVRHRIGDWFEPIIIEHLVLDNFYGTLISNEPLDLGPLDYLDISKSNNDYTLQMLFAAGETAYMD